MLRKCISSLCIFITSFTVSGIASPGSAQSNAIPAGEWKIEKRIGKGPGGRVTAYLVLQESGEWSSAVAANPDNPNVERLWLDTERRRVGLYAYGTSDNTVGDAINVCDYDFTGPRPEYRYSLCNSAFRKKVKDIGLIFGPIQAVTGMNIQAFHTDRKKLRSALAGIDLDAFANEAREAERQAEQDRREEIAREQMMAERRRKANEERKRAEQQIVLARLEAKAKPWRANLAPGDEVLCGMIVEKRKDIVQLQMPDKTKWVRWEKVFPRQREYSLALGGLSFCASL